METDAVIGLHITSGSCLSVFPRDYVSPLKLFVPAHVINLTNGCMVQEMQ